MENLRSGRIIFLSDIDDTLLNTDKTLSEENREAVLRFLDQGHLFALSTGRARDGAAKAAKKLGLYGLKNFLIVSYNGGLITDTHEEKVLCHHTVPQDLIGEVFDLAKQVGVHIQSYTDTSVVSETDNASLRHYLYLQKLPVLFVDNIRTCGLDEPTKLLVVDYQEPRNVQRFRTVFEKQFAGRLDCFNSNQYLLEIVPPGINKGSALRFLADWYKVPIENTISAGDAENDMAMILAAGIGCAVANADEPLKAAADYVTENDNDHGAIAEILHRFCGI